MRLGAPLIVGIVMITSMVFVQAAAVTAIVRLVRRQVARGNGLADWAHAVMVFVRALLLILAAQLVQIAAWAALFMACHEFSDFPAAFYHSAVNFTTLGYGDVVMSPAWSLLGPLEAVDGMLMFGVSTAVLFAVTEALVRVRERHRDSASEPS